MTVQELVKTYVHQDQVFLMQLATSKDGQPWCCTVHFAADDDCNLYWISTPVRRHSQELAANPKAAAAIVIASTAKPCGVQVQGTVREITDPKEIEQLIPVYEQRLDRRGVGADIIAGTNPHHLYQLQPELIVLFDPVSFPDDPRQEWKVNG